MTTRFKNFLGALGLVFTLSAGTAMAQTAAAPATGMAAAVNGSGNFNFNTQSSDSQFGHSTSTSSTAGVQQNFGFSNSMIGSPKNFTFGATGQAHNDTATTASGTAGTSNSNFSNNVWGKTPAGFDVEGGNIATFASGSATDFSTTQNQNFHSDAQFAGNGGEALFTPVSNTSQLAAAQTTFKTAGFDQGTHAAVAASDESAVNAAKAAEQTAKDAKQAADIANAGLVAQNNNLANQHKTDSETMDGLVQSAKDQVANQQKINASNTANLQSQIDGLNETVAGQKTTAANIEAAQTSLDNQINATTQTAKDAQASIVGAGQAANSVNNNIAATGKSATDALSGLAQQAETTRDNIARTGSPN